MMLKAASSAAACQAKAGAAPVRRSALVTARAPISKHQAFKGVPKRSISTAAAQSEAPATKTPLSALKAGDEFEGRVTKVEQFGAFVDFGAASNGLVHISQLSDKYVKNIEKVVKVNDVVRVRVMSVDAGTGRIALTMKGMAASAEAEEEESVAAAVEDEEEEEVAGGADDEEIMDLFPEEGYEYVLADEEPELLFTMAEEDPEMTLEAVADFERQEDVELEVHAEAMPVALGEVVSGKVSRVEEFGVFVEFQHNGKTFNALLERDEAKVPSASLTPEQLAEYVEEGEEVPKYLELDIESNPSAYYKPGDEISAYVLEYNEKGQMNLTQWADWEIDEQAAAAGLEFENAADLTVDGELDVLAMDPLELLGNAEEDDGAIGAEDDMSDVALLGGEGSMSAADNRREFAYSGSGALSAVALTTGELGMAFPSRPLNAINVPRLFSNIGIKDIDFDGDEIQLDDYWQEGVKVPKKALKMIGLKMQYNEAGEPQIVEREGREAKDIALHEAFEESREKRVAAFVADLMSADDEEAELPALASRHHMVFMAAATANISASTVKELRDKTGAGMMDCKKALAENDGDFEKATEWLRKKGLAGADKKAGRVAAEGVVANYIHPGSRLGVLLEVNCETDFVAASDKFQGLVGELGMIIASCPDVLVVNPEDVPAEILAKERDVEMGKEDLKSKPEAVRAKIVEGRVQKIKDNMALVNQASLRDPNKTVAEVLKETIAAVGENIKIRRFVRYNLGEGLEKRANDFAAEVAQQTQAKKKEDAPKKEEPKKEEPKAEEKKPAVQVAASVVKELRDKTGAGMMDCKKALAENNGDMEASIEWLRKKGLAGADKKAGRLAAEGAVAAYIHPGSRLGVLLEVNCETDFVAASDKFNQLVNAIAMQIAASPSVAYVAAEEIPAEVYAREKEIEMGREDLKGKPDAIRAKIAEGRVAKLAQDMALLPQPFLMDPSKTVEQAVKEAIAAIGEKISIRRFVKYQLGEGIEKKESNLAADVAAMASGKA